jgi:O-antigen/teichoic acid export membrane protein
MNEAADSVRRGMASGAAWMIAFRMCDRLIGMVSTVVLARLLTPEHFGVIAMAMALIAFLDMIGDFSFEMALIRDQEAGEEHYHTAWTARVINSVIQCAILNAAAGATASAFDEPRLGVIVHCLSFTLPLRAVQSIRISDMRKDLDFRAEFNFRMWTRIVGFLMTLVLAFLWRDHWALVVGTLATSGLQVILSFVMRPYRPKLTLSRIGDIFGFSKWLIIGNLFSAVVKRSPAFVIARLADAQTLGLYTIGNQICSMAATELIAPIKRALFPGYSKLASDFDTLRKVYMENFAVIVMMAMPVAAGIGLTARFLVPVFLGENWLAAIPVMQVLSLNAAFRTVHTNSNPLFYATNNPRFQVIEFFVEAGVLLPTLWISVASMGAVGAAWATALSGLAVTLLDAVLVVHLLSIPWIKFVSSTWRTPASIAGMWYVVALTTSAMHAWSVTSVWKQLFGCALAGALAYVAGHLLLWRASGMPHGAEAILLRYLRQRLSRDTLGRGALSRAK